MSIEIAVLGLGNPGPEYHGTRHNVGAEVVRHLAARFARKPATLAHRCLVVTARMGPASVLLAQPMTYMNRSGEGALAIAEAYNLTPDRLWVVVDDFQISLGSLRIRTKGSDGGHNGLTSIIDALGTLDFPRFRLGTGMPSEHVGAVDYVLGHFTDEEQPTMDRLAEHAAEAVTVAAQQGISRAMSRFNGSILAEEA